MPTRGPEQRLRQHHTLPAVRTGTDLSANNGPGQGRGMGVVSSGSVGPVLFGGGADAPADAPGSPCSPTAPPPARMRRRSASDGSSPWRSAAAEALSAAANRRFASACACAAGRVRAMLAWTSALYSTVCATDSAVRASFCRVSLTLAKMSDPPSGAISEASLSTTPQLSTGTRPHTRLARIATMSCSSVVGFVHANCGEDAGGGGEGGDDNCGGADAVGVGKD